MKNKNYSWLRKWIYLLVLLIIPLSSLAQGADIKDEFIIADVSGTKIFYKDIKLSLAYKRGMGSDSVYKLELKRLAKKITIQAQKKALEKQGIYVTAKDIDNEFNNTIDRIEETGISKDEFVAQIQNKSNRMIVALKALQKTPFKSDQIYTKYLSAHEISKEEWGIWGKRYDTFEKIQELEDLTPQSVQEMKKNSIFSLEQSVMEKKLDKFISQGIIVSEKEKEAYYKEKYAKSNSSGYDNVKGEIKQKLFIDKKNNKKKIFKKEAIKEAIITIHNNEFKDVTKLLK